MLYNSSEKIRKRKGVFLMDALPGALRVLIDWAIMLLGRIFTYFSK